MQGPAAQWQQWWSDRPFDSAVEQAARRQGYVLDGADVLRMGVSRSAQRTAVRRGRWTAAGHGGVAPLRIADEKTSSEVAAGRQQALAASAAWLRRPDHVVSGRSAAVLHGLPIFAFPAVPQLTAPPSVGLGRRASAHAYGAWFADHDMTAWHGVPVATVARTVADLARHDRWDGLLAADAALREGLTTAAELDVVLDGARGWPGVRQAREIVALADPLSESPLESLTRLRLADDGFPPPQLQVPVGRYRVDFCWPRQRLILEADGRGKYTDDELWAEKVRENEIRALGWRVERVLWRDVTTGWAVTRRRLATALAA